jgi:hypothetical protein
LDKPILKRFWTPGRILLMVLVLVGTASLACLFASRSGKTRLIADASDMTFSKIGYREFREYYCSIGKRYGRLHQVSIHRQSRWLYFVSRSKRLNGVANAAPQVCGHLAVAALHHRFNWSNRLSSSSCFRMYSRITFSSRPTVDT